MSKMSTKSEEQSNKMPIDKSRIHTLVPNESTKITS